MILPELAQIFTPAPCGGELECIGVSLLHGQVQKTDVYHRAMHRKGGFSNLLAAAPPAVHNALAPLTGCPQARLFDTSCRRCSDGDHHRYVFAMQRTLEPDTMRQLLQALCANAPCVNAAALQQATQLLWDAFPGESPVLQLGAELDAAGRIAALKLYYRLEPRTPRNFGQSRPRSTFSQLQQTLTAAVQTLCGDCAVIRQGAQLCYALEDRRFYPILLGVNAGEACTAKIYYKSALLAVPAAQRTAVSAGLFAALQIPRQTAATLLGETAAQNLFLDGLAFDGTEQFLKLYFFPLPAR